MSYNNISNVHVDMPTHNYPNNEDIAFAISSDEEHDNLNEEGRLLMTSQFDEIEYEDTFQGLPK